MFATYSEIVKVVFGQIVSDYMFEKADTSTKLKIHARLTGVLEILFPGVVGPITISVKPLSAHVVVPFILDDETLTVTGSINFDTLEIKAQAI